MFAMFGTPLSVRLNPRGECLRVRLAQLPWHLSIANRSEAAAGRYVSSFCRGAQDPRCVKAGASGNQTRRAGRASGDRRTNLVL